MLIIRDAQISALQEHVIVSFDRSLAKHLRQFAPRESQALEEEDLLTVVRLGRQRAAEFGFTNRESIRLYLELMFLFGSGFSTDPQYPWAARTLASREEEQDQRQRAIALHSSAIQYLHTVLGAKREFVLSARKRLLELRDFLHIGSFPESLIEKLGVIFPEKCEYLGIDRIRTLISFAKAVAEQHGLIGAAAPVLVTILMFLLGHEVHRDPIHPWVGANLRSTAFLEPSMRIQTLENIIWERLRDGMERLA